MTATQPPLPGFSPAPERPTRRARWEAELRCLARLLDDERARDRQRHAAQVVVLQGQLAELRNRMCDLERTSGMADIGRAPTRRGELRRFVA